MSLFFGGARTMVQGVPLDGFRQCLGLGSDLGGYVNARALSLRLPLPHYPPVFPSHLYGSLSIKFSRSPSLTPVSKKPSPCSFTRSRGVWSVLEQIPRVWSFIMRADGRPPSAAS
eukprot:1333438-Amorphochlora_amoeboformis.AAC.1